MWGLLASARALQALVVHDEAPHQVLVEPGGRPLPEPRALCRSDAEADRDDRGQAVVLDHARDLARSRAISLSLNYPELPDSCLRVELALFVHVAQVLPCSAAVIRHSSSRSRKARQGLV